MVIQVVGALAAAVKVNYSRTLVDSYTAWLHYHCTTIFLLVAGALVMAGDFVGDGMQCLHDGADSPKPINTFCWITSTFTINSTDTLKGLGTYNPELHEKTVHAYYQWVPIVLAIQAGLFYLPHYLWKTIEGKQVDHLLQDLNRSLFDDDADKKIKNMVDYLRESWGLNVKYYLGHFLCECLYLVNVVMQMFLMDKFFSGAFMSYGTKVFEQLRSTDDLHRNSRMLEVFPRMAKCLFYSYGMTGEIQTDDAFCILPQNIINEKIYLFMWVWFIILTIITCLQILWHVAVYSSVALRTKLMGIRIRATVPGRMKQALRHMHIGDFCLLNSIGKNLEVMHFRKLLEGVTNASEEVLEPSAPLVYGTYRPFSNNSSAADTLPRKRNLYPTLSIGE